MAKKIKYYYHKAYKLLELYFWRFIAIIYSSNYSQLFKKIILNNRDYLKKIKTFIPLEDYKINDYGIPNHIYKNINKQINKNPTYSDLIICLLISLKKESLNYLEIGVSVMKNFMQVGNQIKNSNLVAYDINSIVSTFSNSFIADSDLSNLHHKFENTNNFYYFNGDVLSKSDALKFSSKLQFRYDFIMSDAMHTKEGVIEEFKNLIIENLSNEFVLYYDDLDFPELEEAVIDNFSKLNSIYGNISLYTFWISGWIGQHEKMHKNGIITNINLEQILNENNIKLPFFKKIK